jgi:cell division septation protein DedD
MPGLGPPATVPRALPSLSPTPAEPRFLVHIGPFASLERARQIAGDLASSGLRAVVERGEEPRQFLVVSEPLLPDAAERRRMIVDGMGYRPRVRTQSNGLAQLELGPFPSAETAEQVARELRRRGYYGAVMPEGGTGHSIILGPHGQSMVDDIVDRMRTRFGTVMTISVRAAP